MAKQYITERDIEDLAARGDYYLTLTEKHKLTDLAFEKAQQLGVKLIPPGSPTVSTSNLQGVSDPSPHTSSFPGKEISPSFDEALRIRIRSAIRKKFGDQINAVMLETIITRVLTNIGEN